MEWSIHSQVSVHLTSAVVSVENGCCCCCCSGFAAMNCPLTTLVDRSSFDGDSSDECSEHVDWCGDGRGTHHRPSFSHCHRSHHRSSRIEPRYYYPQHYCSDDDGGDGGDGDDVRVVLTVVVVVVVAVSVACEKEHGSGYVWVQLRVWDWDTFPMALVVHELRSRGCSVAVRQLEREKKSSKELEADRHEKLESVRAVQSPEHTTRVRYFPVVDVADVVHHRMVDVDESTEKISGREHRESTCPIGARWHRSTHLA